MEKRMKKILIFFLTFSSIFLSIFPYDHGKDSTEIRIRADFHSFPVVKKRLKKKIEFFFSIFFSIFSSIFLPIFFSIFIHGRSYCGLDYACIIFYTDNIMYYIMYRTLAIITRGLYYFSIFSHVGFSLMFDGIPMKLLNYRRL